MYENKRYQLTARDEIVLSELNRFRFCLSRHVRELAGFPSQRTCERRLTKLMAMGYVKRQKVLYGVPYLYSITAKAGAVIGQAYYKHAPRVDKIKHDIVVLDTALYFKNKYGLNLEQLTSEKQLHAKQGFSKRTHQPDLSFTYKGKSYCVEVELSVKARARVEANARLNYRNYDYQLWVLPKSSPVIHKNLLALQKKFPNVIILDWLTMQNDG